MKAPEISPQADSVCWVRWLRLLVACMLFGGTGMAEDQRPARDCIAFRTASVRFDRTGTATYVRNTNPDRSLTVTLNVTNAFTGKSEGQTIVKLAAGQEKQLSWVSDFSAPEKKRYSVAGAEYR